MKKQTARMQESRAGATKPESRKPAKSSIADLIGSVDGLPADLSARSKHYLRSSGYGRKRPR